MAKKEFKFQGKSLGELQEIGLSELSQLLPAAARRKIKRGFSDSQKTLLKKIRSGKKVKTHCRDMIILPEMVGKTIEIFNGKAFNQVLIQPEMIGHLLGEFSLTRPKVAHNAPGVGATRSSASVSVR